MAHKLIDIMSATADELAEIEGIDSGMAFTIVEIISQNHDCLQFVKAISVYDMRGTVTSVLLD
jgi:hypothetical protein